MFAARQNHLRPRGSGHARVTSVELFFDLVFVFAVTQLSHGLLEHLTPIGAVQIAVLMIAVWWQWIDTAWITNWIDPDRAAVRLLLFALMLAALVIAAAIPRAFEDRGAVLSRSLMWRCRSGAICSCSGRCGATTATTSATSCASRSGTWLTAGRSGSPARFRTRPRVWRCGP